MSVCVLTGIALLLALPTFASNLFAGAETQAGSFAQPLYGMWYTSPRGNPDTDPIRHTFRHNSNTDRDEIIVTRLCPGDYRAVIARATSPIEVSANAIRILRTATDSEKGEGNTLCEATVEAGLLNYAISQDGDRLTVTNPSSASEPTVWVRQDAAREAVLPPGLFGTWLLPEQGEGSAIIQIRLIFYSSADGTRGTVRQIATCSKGNDSLLSQAESPITLSKDEIKILQAASHEAQSGPFTCKATITPGTLHYSVSPNGATMTLRNAGGQVLTLTREKKSSLN